MPGWITGCSRSLRLSLGVGVLAAFTALPSFTDPWPSNVGGFLFVVIVTTVVVRSAITLGQSFLQGWREPRPPVTR
ncbi:MULTISPECIES: hypothetical protein [unclassified Geodermatophilus]|uniref:hypothetical protein n=1 Tax=unclassified Geodermatophilus TaxID=2637632 RepID=UPI003EEF59C8